MSDTQDDRRRSGRTGTDRRTPGQDEPTATGRGQGRADTDRKGRSRVATNTLKWLSGVVSVVGLWIAVSPFVYGTTGAPRWNNVATGVGILLLGGFAFYRVLEDARPDVGSASLAALFGVWAVVAPFLLPYQGDGLVWSTMASGIAVAVLAGYSAYESRRTETATVTGAGG